MAKVSFANLRMKIQDEVKTIDIGNQMIEVKQYLPIADKYDLIMISLQQAKDGKVYNPLKLDMFFHLNIVYLYTNLSFTDKQKEDPEKLYDILQTNGVITAVMEVIPSEEWEVIWDTLLDTQRVYSKWEQSAAGMLEMVIDELPKKAETAANLLEGFNAEDYAEVIRFAQAGNADRPIPSDK